MLMDEIWYSDKKSHMSVCQFVKVVTITLHNCFYIFTYHFSKSTVLVKYQRYLNNATQLFTLSTINQTEEILKWWCVSKSMILM